MVKPSPRHVLQNLVTPGHSLPFLLENESLRELSCAAVRERRGFSNRYHCGIRWATAGDILEVGEVDAWYELPIRRVIGLLGEEGFSFLTWRSEEWLGGQRPDRLGLVPLKYL